MKKKVLFSLCLLAGAGIQAQVGVNNTDPKASLHITPQKTDGTTAEGIIAPNLTRAQLIGKDVRYTAAQKGAIVYVTTLDGTISAKTTKITTIGYYYFDGALWQPFSQAETIVPTEPWRVQGGAAQAISNTENIYQAGKVAIGVAQTGAAKSETLYVDGDTHLQGTTKVGTTTVPASFVVTGTTHTKAANVLGVLKYVPTTAAVTVGQYMRASAVDGSVEWGALPTTATTEPWRVQGSTVEATTNTQSIYQMGRVNIGESTDQTTHQLQVTGATLLKGTTTVGTTTAPASFVVTGTTHTKAANVLGVLKYKPSTTTAVAVGQYMKASAVDGSVEWGALPTTATTEPWRVQGGTTLATSNTENIYQAGKVAIGVAQTTAALGQSLYVNGATLLQGATQVGTSAAPSNITITGTSALVGTTQIGTAAAPATLTVTGTTASKATNMGGLLKYKPTATAVTVGQYMRASAVDGSVEWGALPTTATTEPWRIQGGTDLATGNGQHIYQAGRVAIGLAQTSPAFTQALYVNGATLLKGSTTVGTTAAPSNLTITGTSALVGNTQVGTAAAPTNLTVTGTSALVKATTVGTTAANANLVVNGNAGIGAAPLHKLHVAGNEYVSGRAKVGGAADPATLFASAQLELADTDKGFLPNRVALTNSTIKAPVPYAVDGMMVYNTATVAAQDISPGFYYWKANRWNRLVDVIPQKSISLLNLRTPNTSSSVNGGGGTATGTHLAFTNKEGIGDYIEIPEDGSYAFSFRLYGEMSGISTNTTIVYYLNLMRGTTILDVAEMDIPFIKNPTIGQVLTYSVTLGADLVAGDKVYFRLGHFMTTPYPWALSAHSSNSNAARTSMVWWKL